MSEQPSFVRVQHSFADHIKNPEVIDKNIERFEEEINDLQVISPTLYALGNDVFEILNKNLSDKYKIIKLTHYAWQRSKEQYKEKLWQQL